ncbi:LysM peptidoglycan-binding domain-containing protein [Microbacterium timonense]
MCAAPAHAAQLPGQQHQSPASPDAARKAAAPVAAVNIPRVKTAALSVPRAVTASVVGLPRSVGTAFAAVTSAAPRAAAEAAPTSYTVQRGDTVSRIAARFGLRTTDVLALNGLGWSTTIYPGQVLRLTGAGAAPSAPASPPTTAATYTVQRGDTISAIARRHGTTTNAVLAANGLGWSSIIYPGQAIKIPTAGAAASTPAPPTPAAPAPAPQAPAPQAPAPAAGTHTVSTGDTISAIARRYGVTTDAVLAANGLNRSSIIYPGQTIAIPGAATTNVAGLSGEQAGNAQLIIRIGRELGVSDRGIAIALGTAMQESSLRNLSWGDRDSQGLFQQRPSYGWGTTAEVQDAARATRVFFGGPADPNGSRTRGLLDIPGWQNLTFAQAAQAVQISAYPDAYAKWEAPAYAWLAALG